MLTAHARLANDAWEALSRSQLALARRFTEDPIWSDLSTREYDVLYTLSKAPDGLRMSDVNRRVMLTQPGVSRLVDRLEGRGFVARHPDPIDARVIRVVLTEAGSDAQKRIGRRHAATVAAEMSRALDADELEQLRRLCARISDLIDPENERTPS